MKRMQVRPLRLLVVLALVALPACKAPEGKKNKPVSVEAGLGVDPIGAALTADEAPKDEKDPAVVSPDAIDAPKAPIAPQLDTTNQVTEVEVRGWDPQDKKEIVGKPRPSSSLGKP